MRDNLNLGFDQFLTGIPRCGIAGMLVLISLTGSSAAG